MHSTYLTISQLEKRFADFVALQDISLTVKEGEFVCFLGPSGCGKTTLLRTIAGLEVCNEGRIEQAGIDITDAPAQLRDFGIVFQSYALFPNLNVADNISYGLVNKKLSAKQRNARVKELLLQIDMPGIEDKYPNQLSGGQQQRVALARALAMEPGLLLLDEPLSALDAQVRLHLRQEICKLQRSLGITTIMVTHDQEEALTMADRIVVMNQGKVEQIGTPEEIYNHPSNAFVAGFIGSMNLIKVEVQDSTHILIGGKPYRFDLNIDASITSGLLGFRPEAVTIKESRGKQIQAEQTTRDVITLAATIQEFTFMGAFCRFQLNIGADSELTIELDISSQDPLLDSQHSCITEKGSAVYLQVEGKNLHFYPHKKIGIAA
ncbi:MAG: putative 2-aminoethylphosphonate ABC transporter ATP-binding protein [Oceanospirillaceae bacterium]